MRNLPHLPDAIGFRPIVGRVMTAAMLLLSMTLGGSIARANTLEKAVENMAENISDYLDQKGQRQIALQPFVGPSSSTAGRAIQSSLKKALEKRDATVQRLGTDWTVRGSYSMETVSGGAIVLIKAELVDSRGKEISGFREKVKVEKVVDVEDISRLLGSTVDLTEEQTALASAQKDNKDAGSSDSSATEKLEAAKKISEREKDVAETLVSSLTKPEFAFRNSGKTAVAASDESLFRVEMLVRDAGTNSFRPMGVENVGGFPFAPLKANDVYKLKIYNDSDHAIGVKVSIDGINSFALADRPEIRELGTWFIPPSSAGVIPGWYINNTLAKEFLVTASGEDLGLPNALDIGTVTVQFFNAWREGEPKPEIELAAREKGQLRTGVGRDVSRQGGFQQCFFGKVLLSSVSLRYSNPDDLPE